MSATYQIITDKILSIMSQGTVPWRKTWSEDSSTGLCANLISKTNYRGINRLLTSMMPYNSRFYVTYKQAIDLGANVRKGEKGLPIVFWNFKTENEGDPDNEKSYAFIKYYTVFNVDQCENIPTKLLDVPIEKPLNVFTPIESAENIVSLYKTKPEIKHIEQRAYYSKTGDHINMPKPETFTKPEEYYSTLFHELGHSTGAKGRLERKSLLESNVFGDHSYSKEELVAEMTAAFLCAETNISPMVIDNQASYISNWMQRLQKDNKLVIEAAQQAQKACDYIKGIKFEIEQKEEKIK